MEQCQAIHQAMWHMPKVEIWKYSSSRATPASANSKTGVVRDFNGFHWGSPKELGENYYTGSSWQVDKICPLHSLIPSIHSQSVATIFTEHVYKLYGMPKAIVSDRDGLFTSEFWKELWALQGSKLNFSTSFRPQTDGQTEVVNRCVETYLHCFCSHNAHDWAKWLPWALFWYNTSWHSSIKTSRYQALYGRPTLLLLPSFPGQLDYNQ